MYPRDMLMIKERYHEVHSKSDMMRMYHRDTLVVSEETEANARQVLKERGYHCKIAVVPMVRDQQGREIHSTDIIKQEEEEDD
jgi:phosphopantetheine adenylyltransferase